jgi:hypothetical protein
MLCFVVAIPFSILTNSAQELKFIYTFQLSTLKKLTDVDFIRGLNSIHCSGHILFLPLFCILCLCELYWLSFKKQFTCISGIDTLFRTFYSIYILLTWILNALFKVFTFIKVICLSIFPFHCVLV